MTSSGDAVLPHLTDLLLDNGNTDDNAIVDGVIAGHVVELLQQGIGYRLLLANGEVIIHCHAFYTRICGREEEWEIISYS